MDRTTDRTTDEDPDFAEYVRVRWPDLVGGLEAEGVAPEPARLAVASTLLAHRRGWRRFVREQQVDVVVWVEVLERVGVDPGRPGGVGAVPVGAHAADPADVADPWLARAAADRAVARGRTALRSAVAVVVVAALVAGWAWWAARPDPPPVREEANPLPVVWYASGELHLADVVVQIPDVEEFVAVDTGVVARLGTGEVVRVDADGAVADLASAPTALTEITVPPAYVPPGRYDNRIQSAPLPGGGWVHLIDSSRRLADGDDALRQSESGRRAFVVCPTTSTCSEPRTVVGADSSVRLR